MKIRERLTLQFLGINFGILIFFSLLIYVLSDNYKDDLFYARLEEKGTTIAKLLLDVNGVNYDLLKKFDRYELTRYDNEKVSIYNENRRLIYSSDVDEPIPIGNSMFDALATKKEIRFQHGDLQAAIFTLKDGPKNYFIVVSALDFFGYQKMNNLLYVLFFGFFIALNISVWMGWFFAGRALKPIPNLVESVRKITASNMSLRLYEGNKRDELSLLAITFNNMLDRLEESFILQKNFVSNASHELRTPLTAMQGHLEVALLKARTPEEYLLMTETVLNDLKRMIELVNGLLDLSESRFDVSQIEVTDVRVDELVLQAISDIQKKYEHITIYFELSDDLDDESILTCRGSSQLLKTVFNNLIENACKYGKNQDIEVWIGLTASKKLCCKITDHGIGIPYNEQEKIFTPIYRTESAKHIPGHGLGLALVKRIIELHNFHLLVDSKVNEGTTITVVFSEKYLQSKPANGKKLK